MPKKDHNVAKKVYLGTLSHARTNLKKIFKITKKQVMIKELKELPVVARPMRPPIFMEISNKI